MTTGGNSDEYPKLPPPVVTDGPPMASGGYTWVVSTGLHKLPYHLTMHGNWSACSERFMKIFLKNQILHSVNHVGLPMLSFS